MIPYKIIGYILKASMTMDEVNEVLKKSTEYLKKIGRESKKAGPEKRSPEKELEKYLLDGSQKTGLPDQKKMENLLVFSLKEEDQEKDVYKRQGYRKKISLFFVESLHSRIPMRL